MGTTDGLAGAIKARGGCHPIAIRALRARRPECGLGIPTSFWPFGLVQSIASSEMIWSTVVITASLSGRQR